MTQKRILMVDDSATVRAYFKQILTPLGFEIEEAVNGYEGYEKAIASPPDLILADVNMVKMNGYAMTREIRADTAAAAVPVIMISTEGKPDDSVRAYASGANVYLVKPVKPNVLIRNVKILLGEVL